MLDYDHVKNALLAAAEDLISRENELCLLDSYVGDGDHGVTIKKGYRNVIRDIDMHQPANLFDLFFCATTAIADVTGGAIGPLLASFFLGIGTTLEGKNQLETADLANMFKAGLDAVQDLGEAKPGDRTMIDALYPAVLSLQASVTTEETDPKNAMRTAADAALSGAKSTAQMKARIGRAKNLGDKSVGYVDAGAMSMYYFLKAFADNL